MKYAQSQLLSDENLLQLSKSPSEGPRNSIFIATINCKHRLPTTFNNVHKLFQRGQENARPIDFYCVNLQQIVYRGARTFLNGTAEEAPGRAWL